MKRIILVGLMVLSVSAFSLDHGLISGFEVGFNIYSGTSVKTIDSKQLVIQDYSDSLSIKLITGYRIKNIRIIGTYTNTLMYEKLDDYAPLQNRYKIELNYTFKNIKIGLYHWCDHPENANAEHRKYLLDSIERKIYVQFYQEF